MRAPTPQKSPYPAPPKTASDARAALNHVMAQANSVLASIFSDAEVVGLATCPLYLTATIQCRAKSTGFHYWMHIHPQFIGIPVAIASSAATGLAISALNQETNLATIKVGDVEDDETNNLINARAAGTA